MNHAPSQPVDLAHEAEFRIGTLRFTPSTREVHLAKGSEIVEPRVMQALVCLVRAQGTVVSRDDLIQQCWAGRAVSEDAVNRCIAKIRQLAEGDGEPSFTIETIPRVGYRLSCASECPDGSWTRRGPSICVLPFANMSDDPQQEYFADGITEDIITDLQKISAVFIVARNTAFTFKGKNVDIVQLSQHLKVSHILEGSVRKAGERVRITAQLVDGATGGHLWAERYDRDLKDIFAVQDEISRSIVRALELNLLAEEDRAIGRRGTENPEAYRLYLMARQNYILGNEADDRPAQAIVRLCRRATEIDPNYAPAWALMALGQSKLQYIHGTGEGGLAAAQRALAIEENLAEAHAVLGRILFDKGQHAQGAAEIAQALRLDPRSYEVNRAAGLLSYRQGHLHDAARYWEKAATLMETDLYTVNLLISCYAGLKDSAGVQRAARIALARCDRTLAQDQNNGAAMSYSAYALAALGERERAKERMERALLIEPDNVNRRYNFACSLALFVEDIEAALDVLGPAVAKMGPAFLDYAKADPDLASLRSHPRFKAMMAAAEARVAEEVNR
ncbi:MAG: winged helix-turn-helix domain-containing protein [Alphaproteobacteria bacterium]|nr:winged helix-turn-helix domain-containing protein [Alphaproteobacteria bacterium]